DLSGSQQGAGGVGGLLSMTVYASTNAGTYFYSIDGNGNVAALVNAVNGTLGAQYEYGPFGEVIRQTGPMAKMNPIRFSTKYQDDESDLLYYGYRYYKPSTGIWASRDPIEERGGRNVYGFLRNDPLNKSDRLGLLSVGQHIPVDCHCGVSTVKIGEIEVISYERRVVATRGGAHIEVAFHKNGKQCCCCKGDRYNWKSTVIEDTNPQKGKKVPYTDAPPDSYPYYNPESETSGDVDFWDEPSDVSSELTDSNGNNRTVKVHIKTTLVCASGAGGGSFTDFLWGFQYFYDSNGQPQVDLWNP
ncbi:MAG: RHS repeat-associated core domain-containing protein, partial [Negativicutes bacterium]|nr:RHS repeat-associated core domain-containing protein [Negativicutes bacterium]